MKHKYLLFFSLSAAVVALDQVVKYLVSSRLALHQSLVVIPGFLNLVHIRNTGVAFGMFSGDQTPYRLVFFLAASVAAMVVILLFLRRLKPGQRGWVLGLSLVFGGAWGNLIDRVRLGEVIDFVDCYWGRLHWPAFNVADSAVTVGALYLMYKIVRGN